MKGKISGLLLVCLGLLFLGGCSSYMAGSVKGSIVIDAPVEEVYAWVADPANQSKRLPNQTITDAQGPGLGAGYKYYSKSDLGEAGGDEIITEYVPNQLWVEKTITGLDGTGTYTWIFIPEGNKTRIIKVMEVTARVPSAVKMMGREKITTMAQEEIDNELKRIKAEIEK